jgi:DNA-binding transcriptional LysR family regulator
VFAGPTSVPARRRAWTQTDSSSIIDLVSIVTSSVTIMELRHLRYFVAVAEEMSFRRAASRLHIAPPPLSVQIRNLEAEIGADLFSREGRGIRLTEAGRVFLEQARKTLIDAKRAIELARYAANGEIGHLSIGYNAPTGFRIFPKVIPAFKERWPNVRLTFRAHNLGQQLERLEREELDVGFIWLPVPAGQFDVQPLVQEPLVAVLPTDHRLASKQSISVKDLSPEPLILLARELDPDTYHEIETLFQRAGATMNVAYELENSLSMINFVAMGCGCSLLPDYTRAIRQEGVVHRPLRPPNLAKTLAVIKKKGRGGLAEMFFRFTTEHIAGSGGRRRS